MQDSATDDQPTETPPPAPWLTATIDDVLTVTVDQPLEGLPTADFHEAVDPFRKAAEQAKQHGNAAAERVYLTLSALLDMRLTAGSPHRPYEPMAVFGTRRSAIPTDFRDMVPTLAAIAEASKSALVRSRLSDVCWLLERRRRPSALMAIAANVDLVEGLNDGWLRIRFAENQPANAFNHDAAVILRRALQIAKWSKGDEPILAQVDELATRLRQQATAGKESVAALRFATIELDFGLSDPVAIAQELEALIVATGSSLDLNTQCDLWRLASRGYQIARNDQDRYRCRASAAESLVKLAGGRGSPFVQAKFLADAISELHGIPDKKERRRELQHQLVDVQTGVLDELSVFRHEVDIADAVQGTVSAFEKLDLVDKLRGFIELSDSPSPDVLAERARKQIEDHPLAAIFGASHLDHDGKVVHRTEGGLGDTATDGAIIANIVQAESMRRSMAVSAGIEPARQVIVSRHLIAEDIAELLVRHSPFVDPRQDQTFARGIASFFRGDRHAAIYTLTPLLESCLRFVLKSAGHDVTIFDAASQTQQDRMLTSLFADLRPPLEAIFGVEMIHELDFLFLKRPGPALRHAIAHGLLMDGGPYGADAIYACWLMFKLMFIPLVSSEAALRHLLSSYD